jgi:ABC-type lipoprotein export system ATPase subunit
MCSTISTSNFVPFTQVSTSPFYPSFIETRGLSRHYRVGPTEVHALRDVNLHVQSGQFVAVLGVSGSGKSTLLHILGGLDSPDEGAVWVQQRELTALSSQERTLYRRSSVGFIFQSYYLVASLTALENIGLALTFQGVYGSERTRRATEALERVGLGRRSGHRPTELSGGEQQRVAIARAIVHRPMLLLADEPTGNLDRATAAEIIALLREIHDQLGTTVIMVTHDEELASGLADRVLRLRDGRLLPEGDSR